MDYQRIAFKIGDIWSDYWATEALDKNVTSSLLNFAYCGLTMTDMTEAFHISINRFTEAGEQFKYFCGICWKIINAHSPDFTAEEKRETFHEAETALKSEIDFDKLKQEVLEEVRVEARHLALEELKSEYRAYLIEHDIDAIQSGVLQDLEEEIHREMYQEMKEEIEKEGKI